MLKSWDGVRDEDCTWRRQRSIEEQIWNWEEDGERVDPSHFSHSLFKASRGPHLCWDPSLSQPWVHWIWSRVVSWETDARKARGKKRKGMRMRIAHSLASLSIQTSFSAVRTKLNCWTIDLPALLFFPIIESWRDQVTSKLQNGLSIFEPGHFRHYMFPVDGSFILPIILLLSWLFHLLLHEPSSGRRCPVPLRSHRWKPSCPHQLITTLPWIHTQ